MRRFTAGAMMDMMGMCMCSMCMLCRAEFSGVLSVI